MNIFSYMKEKGDLLVSKKAYANMREIQNLPVMDVFDYSVLHGGLIGSHVFYNDYIVVLNYKSIKE